MSAQAAAVAAAALAGLIAAALLARSARAGAMLAWAALGVDGTLAAFRWTRTGHPPLFGTFEADLADALVLLAAALLAARRRRPVLASACAAAGALFPLRGLRFGLQMLPLTISERSLWIDLHALLGYCAFALLFLAAAEAVRLRARPDAGDAGVLSATLLWGFFACTAMIATGMLYSTILFGVPWRWDPAETLALALWLALGTLVHLRLFYRWPERRIAGWLLAAAVLALALFKGLVYFPPGSTYHVFDVRL